MKAIFSATFLVLSVLACGDGRCDEKASVTISSLVERFPELKSGGMVVLPLIEIVDSARAVPLTNVSALPFADVHQVEKVLAWLERVEARERRVISVKLYDGEANCAACGMWRKSLEDWAQVKTGRVVTLVRVNPDAPATGI